MAKFIGGLGIVGVIGAGMHSIGNISKVGSMPLEFKIVQLLWVLQ